MAPGTPGDTVPPQTATSFQTKARTGARRPTSDDATSQFLFSTSPNPFATSRNTHQTSPNVVQSVPILWKPLEISVSLGSFVTDSVKNVARNPMTSIFSILTLLLTLAALVDPLTAAPASTPPLDFTRDIRPILSENCYGCHGAGKHKSGLRLDARELATKPLKSGDTAILPGKPDQSQLVKRINSTDADEQMPPPDSDHQLTPPQIASLTRWIAEGAPYQNHWAFTAPASPKLPAVKNQKWGRNPIDPFILATLESNSLNPCPEADKTTLLRRLSLDLIGLPPTPAEVDSFLADTSPDAYEKQVDRLLANPHYGEHAARRWLDVARYADSNGYQRDKLRVIWPYRDYVINAFNRDLPYDRFITEQIAGDELPHPTQDQIVATGFLRNSMMNDEGGVDPEEFRLAAMFDRVDAVGTGILGLSLQCAQCHSHKNDPLTQDEYYKLFAFLNDAHEIQPIVYTADELKKTTELKEQIQRIEVELQQHTPDWKTREEEWERRVALNQTHWIVLPIEYAGNPAEHWYVKQPDNSWLATPSAPRSTASFTWVSRLPRITAIRLELLTDPTLPGGGPGCSIDGMCALSEFSVEVAPVTDPAQKTQVKFSTATSDFDPPAKPLEPPFDTGIAARRTVGPVRFAIDGDDNTAWGIDAGPGRRNQDRKAVFQCGQPIAAAMPPFPQPAGSLITFHLGQNHGGPPGDDRSNHNLGRFRISATTDAGPITADPLPKNIREILAIKTGRRTKPQTADIFSYWRSTTPGWKDANDRIESLLKQWPAGTTTLAFSPLPQPRDTHVFIRGDLHSPGRRVTPGTPAFLHPLPPDAEPTRLTLARWLVDRQSPTTARAFVNRLWQACFGIGLVETSDDLGIAGSLPSHPELLDFLATEFMNQGWSIKQMQRLIVTSATYRQRSNIDPELYAKDPYNRLLARGPRFRVEGETIRDVALAVSGLLNPKIGGRSVMPPAPAFLFQPPASFAPFPWTGESGDEKYRRALYTFHRRSTPYPALQIFDVPNGFASCARRTRSNSPLQALTSLNEPLYVDCAKALANRAITEGGKSDEERIRFAFRLAVARQPSIAEMNELKSLVEKQHLRFSKGELDPKDVIGPMLSTASPKLDANEWATYTVLARVLLNLDETMTKE